MGIAECLERKFCFEETDLVRKTSGGFDAEFGYAPMSLSLGFDIYTYSGSRINFDMTHWSLEKEDVLVQLHVSQYMELPTFENVTRSLNAAKMLFQRLGNTCRQYDAAYVVSVTDMSLSRILMRFVPSFVPVDSLNPVSKLAQHIQYRRPQRVKTHFPVMVARGNDFIRDTQRF